MKNCLPLLVFILLLNNVSLFSQNFTKGSEYCSYRKSQIKDISSVMLDSPNSPKHKFDVLNYSLNVDIYNCFIGTYPNNFTGSVEVMFRIDTALNTIGLDAYNNSIAIDSVKMNAISYTHTNNILTITLDQTYQPGQVATVKIYYRHLGVVDDAFYASGGFVFTDCEPNKARRWFPCYDHPSDKATMEITARVPVNVKMASNGRLQDSINSGNEIFYHWVSAHPVATYLMIITAKVNYKLDIVYWTNPFVPGATPTPMRFYYNNNEYPSQMEQIIGPLATYYSEHFGNHELEKNGFAALNNQFSWGGMENQTLTSICPGCWYESLIVHEFAHQWFGDAITCATWADIFLNEGFATWSESFWTENSGGYDAYKDGIEYEANEYLQGNPGWPIVNPSWAYNPPNSNTLFNYAITYAKGACVVHQLRYVMGDSAFFAGLIDYATDTNIKFKSAVIEDLKLKMEQAYGQNLDWFFDEWLMKPNHPVYQNTYNIVDMGSNTWRVHFLAKQTQSNPVFFQMPLEIRIRFADATDTVVTVMNVTNSQLFEFFFNKQVTNVYFDPDNEIVLKEASLTVGIEDPSYVPGDFLIGQLSPNPSNESCLLSFDLPSQQKITIVISDLSGKSIQILNKGDFAAGSHEIGINTAGLSTGMYLCTFKADNFSSTRKLIVNH